MFDLERLSPKRRNVVAMLSAIILCGAIIAATFAGGLRRGLDHVTSWGPDTDQRMIAIAISDVVYHLNLGYLAYGSVYDKLLSVWLRGTPGPSGTISPQLWENDKNRDLLNEALTEASSLGPQTPGYIDKPGSFVTGVYNDLGYADFVKLSFRLFGVRIEAMYYTFFVIVSVSTLLFILTFRGDVLAYSVLAFALLAFFIEQYAGIFDDGASPTYAGPRHGTVIAFIPMWHFVMLLLRRTRISIPVVAATLVQLFLFCLAITTRGGALSMVLAVCGVAFLLAITVWIKAPKVQRTWWNLCGITLSWPVAFLLLGVMGQAQYMKSTVHPVYLTDDVMYYHGFWHVAYLGIVAYAPQYSGLSEAELKIQASDGWGYYAALNYMNEKHFLWSPEDHSVAPPSLMSPWFDQIKYRLYETVMERVLVQQIAAHPFAIAWLYLSNKPFEILSGFRKVLAKLPTGIWLLGLAIAAISAAAAHLYGTPIYSAWGVTWLAGLAVVITAAPAVWGYFNPTTNTEAVISLFVFVQLVEWLITLYVLRAIRFGRRASEGTRGA